MRELLRWALVRLLSGLALVLAVSLVTHGLLELTVRGSGMRLLGDPAASRARVAALEQELDLSSPWPMRYARWLGRAVTGDLGRSILYDTEVIDLVAPRLWNSLALALTALALTWLVGFPLGVIAGLGPGTATDGLTRLVSVLAQSTPRVVLGLGALSLAAATGAFPAGGFEPGGPGWHLQLLVPAAVLALPDLAPVVRRTRAAILEVSGSRFLLASRAHGLPRGRILARHLLPNAFPSLITMLGNSIGGLLTGGFLVEVVFSWPGLARLSLEAMAGLDVDLVMASVLMATTVMVVGNLAADAALVLVDPRGRP